MKLLKLLNALCLIIFFLAISFSCKKTNEYEWVKHAVNRSGEQLLEAAKAFETSGKNPRTFEHGQTELVSFKDWTSGFFPGSLWLISEITGKESFLPNARHYTALLDSAQYRTNTHDLGFILYCSYGNGWRLTADSSYLSVLLKGAESLMSRYDPRIGLIRSWDFNRDVWQYPVIIDNMMNLEFLFWAARQTGDESIRAACISHAGKTLENHYRPDNSCYHVVDYDTVSFMPRLKQTHQGFSDQSSWVRGQAWGLYGYTLMYRETRDQKFLDQANRIAAYLLNHPQLPEDKIPYWDFDAPEIPNEPRDASAAAVIASALIELSDYVPENKSYFETAELILKNLSTEEYLAQKGENGYFILKHSTGNWPKKSEIDCPLSYADYYYIEALGRYIKAKNLGQFIQE